MARRHSAQPTAWKSWLQPFSTFSYSQVASDLRFVFFVLFCYAASTFAKRSCNGPACERLWQTQKADFAGIFVEFKMLYWLWSDAFIWRLISIETSAMEDDSKGEIPRENSLKKASLCMRDGWPPMAAISKFRPNPLLAKNQGKLVSRWNVWYAFAFGLHFVTSARSELFGVEQVNLSSFSGCV